MAGLGTFLLEVGVDVNALQQGLNNAESRLTSFGKKAEQIGGKLSLYISAPLALMAKRSIEAFGELEALKLSLGTIEKTSSSLTSRLKELNEVAKLPGIGFKEAIQADVRMRAVGISADIAKRSMLAFGNAIATAGGGKAQFDSVIYQLTQMSAKSKVLSQDFRPIIEAVPAVASAVKKLYGTVDTEQIQSKMSKAGVNSQKFIEEIITELEKLPKVSGGVKNAIENLGDTFFKAFAKIGETIDKNVGIKDLLDRIGESVSGLAESFASISPEVQKSILALGGIAIVIPPLLATIGAVAPVILAGLTALVSPIGLVATAVTALAAIWVDYELTTSRIASASKTLAQIEEEANKTFKSQTSEVALLNDVLQSHNSTLDEKKVALGKLQSIAPQYFSNLTAENLNYSDLNVSISKYITNLQNAAKAQLIKSELDKKIATAADIRQNPSSATPFAKVFGMALSYKVAGDPEDLLKYGNLMKLNAEVAASKIEEGIKPLAEQLKELSKLGYGNEDVKKGSGKGSGEQSEEQVKAAKKAAEAIKKIKEELLAATYQSEINQILDTYAKQKAEAQKNYNDDVKAKMEAVAGKKGLEDEYANFVVQRYKELQVQLRKIDQEEFKTPSLINRKMITGVQNSLAGQQKGIGDKYANSLESTLAGGVKNIDEQGLKSRIENLLGVAEGTINNVNFDQYKNAAQAVLDANQAIKSSLQNLATEAITNMSVIVGQMIAGTATMADLGKSLASTISQALADIAKVQIATGLAELFATGNPFRLLGGIGAGIGSGIIGGMGNKKQSNSNYGQQMQPSYVRGSNINTVNNRYATIKNF